MPSWPSIVDIQMSIKSTGRCPHTSELIPQFLMATVHILWTLCWSQAELNRVHCVLFQTKNILLPTPQAQCPSSKTLKEWHVSQAAYRVHNWLDQCFQIFSHTQLPQSSLTHMAKKVKDSSYWRCWSSIFKWQIIYKITIILSVIKTIWLQHI